MNSITIDGADKALKAAAWCNQQFGKTWNIDLTSMLSQQPVYKFSFTDPHNATIFALRWK